jgi:hypothetical protein
MDKFDRRKFQTVYILTFFLILFSIFALIMEEFQRYPDSFYELSETTAQPFYPEGGAIFLKPSPVYRGMQGKYQAFKFIVIILAVLFLFNGPKVPVFANSFLFVYLIKRFHLSVIAFSLGGRAPPRI